MSMRLCCEQRGVAPEVTHMPPEIAHSHHRVETTYGIALPVHRSDDQDPGQENRK